MTQISNNCMHLGLRVRDHQATMAFYRDALGFEEIFTLTMRDFYETMSNSPDGQAIERKDDEDLVWLTYLRIKDEQYLEIFPVNGEEILPYDPRGGFFHFSLQVDDIDEAVAQLRAKGITVYNLHIDAINDSPAPEKFVAVVGRCNSRLAWIKDPDGNLIEVMQLMPDSMQRLKDSK
jgi:lactoylglutathione lyase